jgi:uncharacterized protein (TIGR01244 family)
MSENAKKVSDDYSAAGQLTPEQLQQAASKGFRSVLNLRSPSEQGTLSDEAAQARAAGLEYANTPISNANPTLDQVDEALEALEDLPTPVLIHCGAGLRAGAVALIAAAQTQNLSLPEFVERAKALELLDQPHIKQFIQKRYGQDASS